MPSSEGVNILRRRARPRAARRAINAARLGALIALLAVVGLGDAAFGADPGATAVITRVPAAARLLAAAKLAPVIRRGKGFAIEASIAGFADESRRFRSTARAMTARLPAGAAGRIELGVGGEGRSVGVRRAFATTTAGRLEGGALVYADAAPGIDAAWLARGDDAEELLVVHEGAAAIAYDLDLPAGSTLIAPTGFPGLVEVRDARGSAWLRMTADAAWDAHGQRVPITARVTGARVWLDVPAEAARPLVIDPTWFGAGRMAIGRAGHTATLLGTGQVLIAGGRADDAAKGMTAELYDPATGRFTATVTPMKTARSQHTATLLRSGQVLLVGGLDDPDEERTAETFDPESASFVAARAQPHPRRQHTATLLEDGRVLVSGGDAEGAATSAETYDEVGSFALTISTPTRARTRQTATTLADGRVLFVGGVGGGAASSIELFDPVHARFNASDASLAAPRTGHTATRLRDGQVLLAGGSGPTAELFDPASQKAPKPIPMTTTRESHTATLLPSGRVLLVGGPGTAALTAEVFDPAQRAFAAADPLVHSRSGGHTATLLPSGQVLIVGGFLGDDELDVVPDAEVFDAHLDAYPATKSMAAVRVHHTATRLHSGKVLIVGGLVDVNDTVTAELYDRATDHFTSSGGGSIGNRIDHTATLLPSGLVLIAGGVTAESAALGTAASLYDPRIDRFRPTRGEMQIRRAHHAATLLPSGLVLLTGGTDESGNVTDRCELFDPSSEEFHASAGRMTSARALHTATLLPSGEVLLVGGSATLGAGGKVSDDLGTAEIYDPITDELRPTGSLVGPAPPVGASTATLLPSGEVLILGPGTPELYDPAAGTFRVVVSASGVGAALFGPTATLLPSGRVLIAGGTDDKGVYFPFPRMYLPATGEIFTPPITDTSTRAYSTATLLASGEVLLAGGDKSIVTQLANARRWSESPDAAFRPQITRVNASVAGGETITVEGEWGALGPDTGSGSTGASSANHPVAVWMPWTGGASFGGIGAWTPHTAKWTAPHVGLAGDGLLFITSDGVTSPGIAIRVSSGLPCTSNLDCHTGQACSAEGRCVDPVNAGLPSTSCAMGAGAPRRGSLAIAFGLIFVAICRRRRSIAISRDAPAAPTSRCRAGRWSRPRRARRAPARRRA